MYKIKLSPYGKIFYTEWLLNPEGARYNIVSADQLLYGTLKVEKLREALKRYVSEHILLNSHLQKNNDELCWVRNDSVSELEYSVTPQSTSELLTYVSYSFNLINGEPLYRFKLLRIKNNVYRFIVVFHHLVMDGISLNEGLFEEVSNYYNDEQYATKYSLEEQIKLIADLTNTLSAKIKKNIPSYNDFWRKQLSGIENIDLRFLKFDKDESLVEQKCDIIKELRFCYGKEEVAKINQVKLRYNITSYGYSQCIFAMLLNKYTGQEKLAICYPIAIKEGLDFIYGAQVNLNLMPYCFNKNTTIVDLFNQHKNFIKLSVKKEPKFGYYPIADITQETNSTKLLDVYFAQAYFRDKQFGFNGIKKVKTLLGLGIDGVTQDILLFEQEPTSDKLNYRIKYDKRAFNKELLNNLIIGYKKLFIEVLEDILHGNSKKKLPHYHLLEQRQYSKVIDGSNHHKQRYPQNKTIHKLFEEQALRTPDNIAIAYANIKLTYRELNNRANQLANYLHRNYHIKPDDLIVLCLDKSEHMIIALLAVLKAGGAYVPVSPNYPLNRIKYILNDTKPKAILTNRKYQHKLKTENKNILAIDAGQLQKELANESLFSPQVSMSSENLIYVLYTSGTTGNPKGVLQQHNNVMRLFTATNDWYHFTDKDVWTLFHSYVFDFTVWEIWGALFYGGKLVMPTIEQSRDINSFYELCYKEKVTILNQTPQAFYQFINIAINHYDNNRLCNLKYIVFGGAVLNFRSLKPWCDLYGYDKPKLINMYGITETTVHVTYKEITAKDIGQSSCIGKVIPDQRLIILDNNLIPLPIGAIGELYIGGAGLARGYLNLPSLTKEKFIINPFQVHNKKGKVQNNSDRLYKTGDLVRMLPDGDLEYIGRNDSQVKIRGYRIELGEIESKLRSYPGVMQAVVLVREHVVGGVSDKDLVAYCVSNEKPDESKMHDYLVMQLPWYMLPAKIIYLDKLPLTINGKLDKNALPEPKFENDSKYIAPGNERENLICVAFAQVLGLKKVGTQDDFFMLGGNSLKAITLTSALQKNFDIKIADVFNLRAPVNLAENLCFGKDMLKQKLESVKLVYKQKQNKKCVLTRHLKNKIERYLKNMSNLKIDCFSKKSITNVLLTGATGFLGCNILNQLLQTTSYNVFVIVRANSTKKAIERINQKLQFYFNYTLGDVYYSRVSVIKADIEKNNLGLLPKEYEELVGKIDSIIHAAALVKHYGDYDKFYSANVQATINLLELSKLTKKKEFHYISTYSILVFDTLFSDKINVYTEDDLPDILGGCSNVYDKTKLEGEQQVIRYRNYGVDSSIYRVGNLAFISQNYRVQEDIENNAFFNWLRCLFKIKCIARDINTVEVSQVDYVAQAIVKLFDKTQLRNGVYHVSNPHLLHLSPELLADKTIKVLSMSKFIDRITGYLNNNTYGDLIVKFLLRQGWLDGWDLKGASTIQVMQNRTCLILKQLGFKWPPVTHKVFNTYLKSLKLQRGWKNGK